MYKFIIAGGSGFIGRHISDAIEKRGGNVTILTRRVDPSLPFKQIPWDPSQESGNGNGIDIQGFDAVVNLSGASIAKRWTKRHKKEMENSRIDSTLKIVDMINGAERKPRFFISASAIGYYGNSENEKFDESSGPGNDFLSNLASEWEGAARRVNKDVRLIIPRFGVVLGKDGGALPQLMRAVNQRVSFNLKGRNSWKSWVHIDDLVSSLFFLMDIDYAGVYNCVAPNPVKMEDMMQMLFSKSGKRPVLKLPGSMTKLLLGEGGFDSIFGGQYVVPSKLAELKYKFIFSDAREAIDTLL